MILDEIVASNLRLLEERKQLLPFDKVKQIALASLPPLDFAGAISGKGLHLIAEVKRASPSKGIINSNIDPVEVAKIYAASGASAISVLTEPYYFNGTLDDLLKIKIALKSKGVPLLRKDFLTDPYQVYEARANGADSILLIVAILMPENLSKLVKLSYGLGMTPLVEVHNEKEIETALGCGARVIGINNRDLTDFTVDIGTTERLRPFVPTDRIVVSESGIKTRRDIERLKKLKVDAVLIGEALMAAPDIKAKIRELL